MGGLSSGEGLIAQVCDAKQAKEAKQGESRDPVSQPGGKP
jgi:hypothetical protein